MLVTFVCIGTSFTVQNNFSKKTKKKQQTKTKPKEKNKSIFIIAKKNYTNSFAPEKCLVIFNISKNTKCK